MKKWGKVLFWIGIVWIILVLIFSVMLYLKVKQFSGRVLGPEDLTAMGGWRWIIETVNASSPFISVLVYFLGFGIPAWILFIIVAIFGRSKN